MFLFVDSRMLGYCFESPMMIPDSWFSYRFLVNGGGAGGGGGSGHHSVMEI